MRYDKLIRDKTPDYIRSKGDSPETHVADDEEYWFKLKERFREEVSEFLENESLPEMADVLEVIDAICEFKRFNDSVLQNTKMRKADERGRFEDRIILDGIIESNPNKQL